MYQKMFGCGLKALCSCSLCRSGNTEWIGLVIEPPNQENSDLKLLSTDRVCFLRVPLFKEHPFFKIRL